MGLCLMPAGLELTGICKRFGATRALDGVDLHVAGGEVVALMGANGAGKSTLAKIACGAEHTDAGGIRLDGIALRLVSPRDAYLAGIAVVHQSTDQLGIPGLSVAENLLLDAFCGRGFGIVASRAEIHRRARKVSEGIGLDLPLDQDFGDLGPAQRQLVAIARAVAAKARILILDEPTASLAAEEAERLFRVIESLRTQGVGILYISHRLGDIRRVADRIVVLRNGRLAASQQRPLDLAGAIRAMIGRDVEARAPQAESVSSPRPVLQLKQVRLLAHSAPFDLAISAGEVVAITGSLGSGKSRLLDCLAGLRQVHGGEIALEGDVWRPRNPRQALRGNVHLAGEDRWRSSLFPSLTPGGDIAGTIAFPHRPRWFPFGLVRRDKENTAARDAIAGLGIRCGGPGDTLDQLSGGNQQKVVIARWQAESCRLLLLDEPFQGVDIGARHDLVHALRKNRSDSATLIATSDVEEAIEVADIVAVMRNHTIVALHDLRKSAASSLVSAIGALEETETGSREAALP
jgi:simple sugar transport system ATP-binding protein